MKVTPVARTESLIVKEVDGETLVYDMKTDKAHCLNDTAARVWKNCDGNKSVSEIAEALRDDTSGTVKDEFVWLALDQLQKFKLLEEAPAKPTFLNGMSRRQMVARLGVAAIALPAIVAIVAPEARAQGSQIQPGGCCTNPNQCANSCDQDPSCIVVPNSPSNSTKRCN